MLDEKDKIIFEHLIHDCRTTTTYLSKVTNLTQPTIVYRIQNLEKEGYISKYDVILNKIYSINYSTSIMYNLFK